MGIGGEADRVTLVYLQREMPVLLPDSTLKLNPEFGQDNHAEDLAQTGSDPGNGLFISVEGASGSAP